MGILVTAKRMGLSFDELNMMTLGDYMDFCDMWVGDDEDEYEREATQADINRFMG